MSQIIDRFRTYPPALQWLLIGLGVIALVILWHDFVWKTAERWNDRAAQYEQAIEVSQRSGAELSRSMQNVILALGEVETLGPDVPGAQALSDEITRVLSKYRLEGVEVKEKTPVSFRAREMPKIIPEGMTGEKLITEVRFESGQDVAYDVIADLERSPKIETISIVRIARSQDPRKETVVVTLQVEAWVVSIDRRSTGGMVSR